MRKKSQKLDISRREFIGSSVSLAAYLSAKSFPGWAINAGNIFPLKRKLVWINMRGGWDILEVMDPKVSSSSGLDMIYPLSDGHKVNGGGDDTIMGRWMPRLAELGEDLLMIKGLSMGTTSHMAGSIYMDTGILSNAGRVNAASIPAIVASEGQSTIPIIQLQGGSTPMTDRGLLKPVSLVRAENLSLYQSMYPETEEDQLKQLKILDYVRSSITSMAERTKIENYVNDRLNSLNAAEQKVRTQFQDQVGAKLSLSNEDISEFMGTPPAGVRNNFSQNFALAYKLLIGGICDCVNLGIGGFDTHSNQSSRLQPILQSVDYVVSRFVNLLKEAGKLDETLIVLYSDFGRTPRINGSNGRDHWPVGGALMIGGGIQGARAVGASDENLRSIPVNFETGLPDVNGELLNPTHLGGAVLELTLGQEYLSYRNYLESIPSLTRLR